MENKILLNDDQSENVSGDYSINTVSFTSGDKFLVDGVVRYICRDYKNIDVSRSVLCIRIHPVTGAATYVGGSASDFVSGTYLGRNLAEFEEVVKRAEY